MVPAKVDMPIPDHPVPTTQDVVHIYTIWIIQVHPDTMQTADQPHRANNNNRPATKHIQTATENS